MDVAQVVKVRLLDVAAVTAVVNARIWTGSRLPNSPTLPAIRVERVSEITSSHLRGGSGLYQARVQVDSVANKRADAVALDERIQGDHAGSALLYWRGDVGSPAVQVVLVQPLNVLEGYDPDELSRYKVMRDVEVHWRM
jgi:hypothetical protein